MKKFLIALVVLSSTAFSSFAQTSSEGIGKFSIGVDAGLLVGNARDVYKLGIGGSLKYDMPLSKGSALTLSIGYTDLIYKGNVVDALHALGLDRSDEVYIPVKAGLKYYFSGGFYGEGQLGVTVATPSDAETSFIYAPGIGYNFGSSFDLGVRYEAWSYRNIKQVVARLAYSF